MFKLSSPTHLSVSRDESAAMIGLLICLVIMGHNLFFTKVFPKGTFEWLYSFHVSCFFILPFFYAEHEFSWPRVLTNLKRLFWPYTYMFLLLFAANAVLQKHAQIDFGLFDTWITGNFYMLDCYTGFQYLWFLPAMFSMLAIKDAYTSVRCGRKTLLIVLGLLCFVMFWIFLYRPPYGRTINCTVAQFSVFSFMIGFAMFFVGLVTKRIMEHCVLPTWMLLTALMAMFVLLVFTNGTSAYNYVWWTARTICPFIGFVLFFCNACVYKCLILRRIGEMSLPIYLLHQPINVAICTLLGRFKLPQIGLFIISYIIVLSVSFLFAKVMTLNGIKKILFPK